MSRDHDPIHNAATTSVRLDHPLAALGLSTRARNVCERLGVATVGDFRKRDRSEFLAVDGCGPRTYASIAAAVNEFAAAPEDAGPATRAGADRPLSQVIRDRRAQSALVRLGLRTVGDFLAAPRERLLQEPGLGPRSYKRALSRALQACGSERWHLELLPERLLRVPVSDLGLTADVLAAFQSLELRTVGDLLEPRALQLIFTAGAGAEEQVHAALQGLVSVGMESFDGCRDAAATAAPVSRLLALLTAQDRTILERFLGIGTSMQTVAEIARALDLPIAAVRGRLEKLRTTLIASSAGMLRRMHEQAARELHARDGVLTAPMLPGDTLLRAAADETHSPELPFRLLAFCHPRHYHVHGGMLTELPPERFAALLRGLRVRTQPRRLPVRLADLEDSLHASIGPVPRGLLLELLTQTLSLSVASEPGGMVVARAPDRIADRLEAILAEVGPEIRLDDLMFHYRDRHRSARKSVLLLHLRTDPRFVEVGPELWTRRCDVADELRELNAQVESFTEFVLRSGMRRSVRDVCAETPMTARQLFLLVDRLRASTLLRSVGRGSFCPRDTQVSGLTRELTQDFRRAMGDVPRSRFLVNLPPQRRTVVARLLRENRVFIEPTPDRVDLLSNYPFNEERLQRLLALVERQLEDQQGYATLDELQEHVNTTDLGGSFLTRHMLRDLLRRHGSFELLPGDLVALASLGLGGWIQMRAREAIRSVDLPLTSAELQRLAPELGEFAEALDALLRKDPMLHTPDGERYALI
jgi:hypothetical protein